MKQQKKTKQKKTARTAKREPLAEGIIVPSDELGRRIWSSISSDKLVDYAKKVIEEKGIKNRRGLEKADNGLYKALRRRRLLDKVGLYMKRPYRFISKMSDEELVEYAKNVIEEKAFRSKRDLAKKDSGLYKALWRRGLLDRLEFEEGRKKMRSWASMTDDEIVEHAKGVIKAKGIKSGGGLCREDSGLWQALRKRNLLDRLEFEVLYRKWAPMSDDKLVGYARRFLVKKKITNRHGLFMEDPGLYNALRKRKLLNRVFAPLEREREKQSVQDVFDALKDFGS